MKKNKFVTHNPETYENTSSLPQSEKEAAEWQKKNKNFWENNPMRYDFTTKISSKEFTKEFYDEIDGRFFGVVKEFMPWNKRPFEKYIPFDKLKNKKVLEIGVGNGSHAQLLATSCDYTGIDITKYAIESSKKRFELNNIQGELLQMDAEHLTFPNNHFDFVWSWGVIHHTSNTKDVISEINRVLKPKGNVSIMVYYKGWWNYFTLGAIVHGLIRGKFFKYGSLHKVIQSETDGAIARYYNNSSWRSLVQEYFIVDNLRIEGAKTDIVPLPAGRIKNFILKLVPNQIATFMTTKLRMGSFLVVEMTKK